MKFKLLTAALLASASPAIAQHNTLDNTSTSGSDANAVSGSQSGASSDNFNVNAGGNNAGIGNSTSNSNSASDAFSGSVSGSESNGNQQGQDQGQAQSANNTQGQTATGGSNSSSQSNNNEQGQVALNEQGVTVNQSWNSTNRRKTVQEFRTNAAVPLAASSSFSSDYCGGTASGGASIAPIGVSIGGAAPTFDKSCQYLRLAEKAGMLGANYYNMRQPDMSGRAMSLMAWATCMAGPQSDHRRKGYQENVTMQACLALGLLGSEMSPSSPPAQYQEPVTPLEAQKPNVQPLPDQYKTPRGDLEYQTNPIIQGENKTTAMAATPPRP